MQTFKTKMTTICELTEAEVEHVRALSELRVMQRDIPFHRKYRTVLVQRQEPVLLSAPISAMEMVWPDGWN